MRHYLTTLLALFAGFLLIVGAGGCYTQLGVTRDDRSDGRESDAYTQDDQPAEDAEQGEEYTDEGYYGSGYGEDWHSGFHVGFNYYYPQTYWPSWGFSAAYADPWYHWYGYDSWYGYPSYYSPWGYPSYYGYYPHHGYYSGFGYPWYGYGGYWSQGRVVPRTNRTFGTTRGSGSGTGVRTSSGQDVMYRGVNTGDMNLPTASGKATTGGTDLRKTGSGGSGENARVSGSSRTPRVKGTSRSSATGSDSDRRRIYRDRRSVSGSGSRDANTGSTPSAEAPKSSPPSTGTTRATPNSGRTRESSQPAVRPAPAQRPSSSSPRPSSSSPSSSGSSRSGSQRPRP